MEALAVLVVVAAVISLVVEAAYRMEMVRPAKVLTAEMEQVLLCMAAAEEEEKRKKADTP